MHKRSLFWDDPNTKIHMELEEWDSYFLYSFDFSSTPSGHQYKGMYQTKFPLIFNSVLELNYLLITYIM